MLEALHSLDESVQVSQQNYQNRNVNKINPTRRIEILFDDISRLGKFSEIKISKISTKRVNYRLTYR